MLGHLGMHQLNKVISLRDRKIIDLGNSLVSCVRKIDLLDRSVLNQLSTLSCLYFGCFICFYLRLHFKTVKPRNIIKELLVPSTSTSDPSSSWWNIL